MALVTFHRTTNGCQGGLGVDPCMDAGVQETVPAHGHATTVEHIPSKIRDDAKAHERHTLVCTASTIGIGIGYGRFIGIGIDEKDRSTSS